MTLEERDRLTRVEERVKDLQSDMDSVKVDVKSILARLDSASGGWKALITLLAAAASLGAILPALAHYVFTWRSCFGSC